MFAIEQRAKCLLILAKQTSPLFQRLSGNLIREICEYMGAFVLLPCITGATLSLYDLRGRLLLNTQLSMCFPPNSFICLGEVSAFYVISAESRFVYHTDLREITQHSLPQMTHFRSFPGGLYWNKILYVFGGACNPPNEKYSVSTCRWIPTACTRHYYLRHTPCKFKGDIYLNGGQRAGGDVEIYNINSDSFTLIKRLESYYLDRAVLVVTEKELIWLSSEGKIVHWCQEELHVNVHVNAFHKKAAPWGRTQVREGSRLYWVKKGKGVCYFDLLRDEVRMLSEEQFTFL